IKRHYLTHLAYGLLGSDAECIDESGYLSAAVADGFPSFDAQRSGQLFEALLEAMNAVGEHLLPLVGSQFPHGYGGLGSGSERGVDRCFVSKSYAGGNRALEFVQDSKLRVGVDWRIRQIVGIRLREHASSVQCRLVVRLRSLGKR